MPASIGEEKVYCHRRASKKCGPKVKTGCITCKIRRVKCDEGKPHCNRCTSTGRTCDGYICERIFHRHRSATVTTYRPSLLQSASSNEVLCYWSAVSLTKVFGNESFWRTSLSEFVVIQPAILYALVALRTAQERRAIDTDTHAGADIYMLQAYNRAIHHFVRGQKVENREGLYAVLIGCAIFTCLEFLKGDSLAALGHIKGAFKILKEEGVFKYNGEVKKLKTSDPSIFSELVLLFTRLRFQALNFDATLADMDTRKTISMTIRNISDKWKSLDEARKDMFDLLYDSYILIYAARSVEQHSVMDLIIYQHRLSKGIVQYKAALRRLIDGKKEWDSCQQRTIHQLQISLLCTSVWVSTCLAPSQIAWDNHTGDFEQLVSLAELHQSLPDTTTFQVDMGILGALHFTGVKCRDPIIRRRVLRLLKAKHWQEGFYDSSSCYRIVHRQMMIEERDCRFGEIPAEGNRITASGLMGLLDSNKITSLKIMLAKSNGSCGDIMVWEDYIDTTCELPGLC